LRRTTGFVAGGSSEGAGRSDGRATFVDKGVFVQRCNGWVVLDVYMIVVNIGFVMQFL